MNVGWKRIAASLLFLIVFDSALKFTFLAIDDLQSADEISAKTRPVTPADRVNTAVNTEHFTANDVILICLGFLAVAPVILLWPAAWQEGNVQPASETCSSATFRVKVANAEFAIPVSPVFTIYRANPDTANDDADYLASDTGVQTFCGLTENGKQPVKATNIALRFGGYDMYAPAICAGPVPDAARDYCAADKSARPVNLDGLDFPLRMYVFAPDEVTLGQFGGSRSTYRDSLNARPRPNGPMFIMSETLTPDQHPLTFECSENGDGYWCKAAYAWRDGAMLQYEFRSGRLDVRTRGSRVDAEARKFLVGLRSGRS